MTDGVIKNRHVFFSLEKKQLCVESLTKEYVVFKFAKTRYVTFISVVSLAYVSVDL